MIDIPPIMPRASALFLWWEVDACVFRGLLRSCCLGWAKACAKRRQTESDLQRWAGVVPILMVRLAVMPGVELGRATQEGLDCGDENGRGVITIWGAFLDLPPPTNRTDEGGQGRVSGLVCPPGGNNEDGGKELRKVCKAQRPASQESSAQAIAR